MQEPRDTDWADIAGFTLFVIAGLVLSGWIVNAFLPI